MFNNFWERAQSLVTDFISEHWLKVLVIIGSTLLAWLLKKLIDRQRWYQRQFLGRVNFSLNIIEGGYLRIRTLIEKELKEVLLNNEQAMRLVLKSAKRTTVADPIVPLPKDEGWLIQIAILNELSEKFSAGMLAADMRIPVRKEIYVFVLTSEPDADVRVRKLRIMIIREALLQKIAAGEIPEPKFEAPTHNVRWKTLGEIARRYQPEGVKGRDPLIRTIELCVPLPAALKAEEKRAD
ncbi:MAG: hypothetical protein MPJ50_08860 [Pirellulales bacterium]|nr:hypothetical protein [Pirellulales bacterium]